MSTMNYEEILQWARDHVEARELNPNSPMAPGPDVSAQIRAMATLAKNIAASAMTFLASPAAQDAGLNKAEAIQQWMVLAKVDAVVDGILRKIDPSKPLNADELNALMDEAHHVLQSILTDFRYHIAALKLQAELLIKAVDDSKIERQIQSDDPVVMAQKISNMREKFNPTALGNKSVNDQHEGADGASDTATFKPS